MSPDAVGILGGTFDPVHRGHLSIGLAVQESFELSRILLVPARQPPHKGAEDLTPFAHRLAMVKAVCAEHPGLEPSAWEGDQAGPSYTVETLAHFRVQVGPGSPLYFIMGADSLVELPTWRDPGKLLELANLIVAPRPGARRDQVEAGIDPELCARVRPFAASTVQPAGAIFWVDMDLQEISGSRIRRLLREGKGISGLVPDCVATYISQYHLYGGAEVP